MWAARDKNGSAKVFKDKPVRCAEMWVCRSKPGLWRPVNDNAFPELKWDDEPLEIDDLYFGIYLW